MASNVRGLLVEPTLLHVTFRQKHLANQISYLETPSPFTGRRVGTWRETRQHYMRCVYFTHRIHTLKVVKGGTQSMPSPTVVYWPQALLCCCYSSGIYVCPMLIAIEKGYHDSTIRPRRRLKGWARCLTLEPLVSPPRDASQEIRTRSQYLHSGSYA